MKRFATIFGARFQHLQRDHILPVLVGLEFAYNQIDGQLTRVVQFLVDFVTELSDQIEWSDQIRLKDSVYFECEFNWKIIKIKH